MKEIVIISGKGGTGKTSLTAAFAGLAKNSVIADCDVDATDLHLICNPEIIDRHNFISGNEAIINEKKCTACGKCYDICRFDAIIKDKNKYQVNPTSCEGCGVCVRFCPEEAIKFPERLCGEWYKSKTRFGTMFHAHLGVAAENSGKLVSMVRAQAKEFAKENNIELVIVDGPPGIGCPVIASITGADKVIIVSEPTLSGEHDLIRVAQLASHFNIPASLIINKWDINPKMSEKIEKTAVKNNIEILGRVVYDINFTKAQINEKTILEYLETDKSTLNFNDKSNSTCREIKTIWNKIFPIN
jgi:MinD superfamily P-loop ATPase